ncbi:hypothetical protein [Flindersiella endophytica]
MRRLLLRLEPVPRAWLAEFVTGILHAVERLPFRSGPLVFGGDEPVLDVRRLTDAHAMAGSRYEYRVIAAPADHPPPEGHLTVRSRDPAGTTAVGAAMTNVLGAGDLATAQLEVGPDALACTASYDAVGSVESRIAEWLRLRARIDVDFDGWWDGGGDAVPLRIRLSHAAASMMLGAEVTTLPDGRWEVTLTLETDGQWWAQPLLRIALEYVQRRLSHRFGSEPGEPVSFEKTVAAIEQAWNDGMPGLTAQSPSRLADQLLADARFSAG